MLDVSPPSPAWGIYPSRTRWLIDINCSMSYQTQELLKDIRVEGPDWQAAVHEQLVATLRSGAGAYELTEAANAAASVAE